MTFKHTNFADSPTMRSLEKLAKDKGLIKEESPLTKIASSPAKANLKPTDNLMENLLKLCSGLRSAGFNKYAEDLESTFMMYKQAASQCECDTDIVEQAHPKGSHKLDGVDGDALIETIIDQHIKDMQIVNKKPTGKLANSSSIINAVKISLADLPFKFDDLNVQNTARRQIDVMSKIILSACDIYDSFPSTLRGFWNDIVSTITTWSKWSRKAADSLQNFVQDNSLMTEEFYVDHITKLRSTLISFKHAMLEGEKDPFVIEQIFAHNSMKKAEWNKCISLIDLALVHLDGIKRTYQGEMHQTSTVALSIPLNNVQGIIADHLVRPLEEIIYNIEEKLNYNLNKSKIPANIQPHFDTFIRNLETARTNAKDLQDNLNRINPRVIKLVDIDKYAPGKLSGLFKDITDINQLSAKSIEFCNTYRMGYEKLNQWIKA